MLIFAAPSKTVGWEKADFAQLVEQLIRNEQVVGSSPIIGSQKKPQPDFLALPEIRLGLFCEPDCDPQAAFETGQAGHAGAVDGTATSPAAVVDPHYL